MKNEPALTESGSPGSRTIPFDRRSAIEIAAALRERHPEIANVADDVHDFLDEMVRLGVLERERARS